ncbi:MAG: hypothetical protein HXX11_09060 [Desulfuromonadales bacterium]|nr:hypothetical protein [Desulfuromonadales bacterium]
MKDQKICCDDKSHHHHMCILKEKAMTAEIERASNNPTVECGICGAKANSADYVCTPAKVWEEGQLS